MASKRRCRMPSCSRSTRRTTSRGSTKSAKSGRFSRSSLMRASNFIFPAIPTLSPKLRKVPRRSFSRAIAFRLQQLAIGQQHPQLLTAQRLHVHRTVKSHSHHLRDAAGIIAIRLVDLCLQHGSHVSCLDTDYRQTCFGEGAVKPLRQRYAFQANPLEVASGILENRQQSLRFARYLHFSNDLARVIHNADAGLLDRHVQSSKMVHAALLLLMLEAASTDLVSPSA